MTFQPNMLTLWTLALVVLLVFVKTALRVVRILTGAEPGPFNIRTLPEFLGDDVLFEVGGLFILAVPTFLASTDLPGSFAVALGGLQALYLAAASSLVGKYLAKIRDIYPVPDDMSDVSAEDRAVADQVLTP